MSVIAHSIQLDGSYLWYSCLQYLFFALLVELLAENLHLGIERKS